jgi:hypothetical protein
MSAKGPVVPIRANLADAGPPQVTSLAHILWMCDEIDRFVDEGRHEKANRWIGFAQGALWIIGAASIDESRQINT